MTEVYELPQGKITISFSDKKLSVGLLELNPDQEYPKHNRPVKEELFQIYGSCVMKLFNEDKLVKEVTLNKGEKLEIPENQFHIHSNPTHETSITLWKFEGDITEIIEIIRSDNKKIL